MTMPLDGVVVADFSRVLAGPLATATLADLGATVIKVERPGAGDETRSWGPPWTTNSSTYFECANRSKQSVVLDLEDAHDVRLAQTLARRADVLVENFKDGALARRGLGYDTVRASNPRVIYCSITGFGSHAGASLAGYDFLVQALGGLMSITGEPDGEPMKAGVALVDVLTAKDATIGILAALAARSQSGEGQRVEVNLLSSLLGALANQASAYLATGEVPRRLGNRHPSIAPYETLACQDGRLAVACGNDRQFRRLSSVLGAADLADDPRFATNSARVRHRSALIEALESRLVTDTVDAWSAQLTAEGVPAGKVGDIADGIALATALGLEPVVSMDSSAPPQVRHPVTFSATPVTTYLPPPHLGEHDGPVRRWLTDLIEETDR
ncbi:CaiB/BaiF CoA-transferase family protein [Angustibacter sp. Root456]|uniref:CaiB/BaiF CoA transferase family protein n=1 Tax=Angustibacter sp. Root456 TaxID=1736539 RepID=UPI00070068C5|nr:CoA transferase [Angustibacter sp. Root456]KQX62698.1 carnitine dehydratase [Angustibacter sp. Root456]